jgi:hypothetical protein
MRFKARAAMVFRFFYPLRFIDNDQFGPPSGDQVEIGLEFLGGCPEEC